MASPRTNEIFVPPETQARPPPGCPGLVGVRTSTRLFVPSRSESSIRLPRSYAIVPGISALPAPDAVTTCRKIEAAAAIRAPCLTARPCTDLTGESTQRQPTSLEPRTRGERTRMAMRSVMRSSGASRLPQALCISPPDHLLASSSTVSSSRSPRTAAPTSTGSVRACCTARRDLADAVRVRCARGRGTANHDAAYSERRALLESARPRERSSAARRLVRGRRGALRSGLRALA